jgi:hypothetical protein
MEYDIQAITRRCAASGRDLAPGEKYYSVLIDLEGKFVRKDFGTEAWTGPPPGVFSFWSGRVPADRPGRQPRIDDEILVECFGRLEGQSEPERLSFRYVVALLLMRRKRFKFEEAKIEEGQEILTLRCSRTGARYRVLNPRLTEAEMTVVQDEVFDMLGWN